MIDDLQKIVETMRRQKKEVLIYPKGTGELIGIEAIKRNPNITCHEDTTGTITKVLIFESDPESALKPRIEGAIA